MTKWPATAHEGSFRVAGRWHRTRDQPIPPWWPLGFPAFWPALYTSLDAQVAQAEFDRNHEYRLGAPAPLRRDGFIVSEIRVDLRRALDCRNVGVLGLPVDDLCRDDDYDAPNLLAAAARVAGVEALLVVSAATLPLGQDHNLIIFPDLRDPSSSCVATGRTRQTRWKSADPGLSSP